MGKKKVGKHRKDKYYHLAKESGFRSRAAFKLVQLNRKYEFLQTSQVTVDLCAAPGGWMQVAAQYMPVSSLLIGVDLVPIASIGNAIALQGDITQDSTKKAIERELKTLSADCVLHDGAPNVGANWLHDAFTQAQLVLSALKLGTSVLRRGGWFVTKVFRSQDYPALIPVFSKLFKKVFVTKPQASRNESAEIFVVCKGFLKPANQDPDLTDPRKVFADTHPEAAAIKGIHQLIPKKKAKAEGYEEGDTTLHHKLSALEFCKSSNFMTMLGNANEIVVDDDLIAQHPATTDEIRENCKDLKVLGRRELKQLFTWRKSVLGAIKQRAKMEYKAQQSEKMATEDLNDVPMPSTSMDNVEPVDDTDQAGKAEARKAEKRRRKKEFKEKRRLRDKVQLEMVHPGDQPDLPEDAELFSLRRAVQTNEKEMELEDDNDDSDLEADIAAVSKVIAERAKKAKGKKAKEQQPKPEDQQSQSSSKTRDKRQPSTNDDAGGDEAIDSDMESVRDYGVDDTTPAEPDDSRDKDALDEPDEKRVKLDPVGLALGEVIANSKKAERELIEWGYNRYANNDENLPDWFLEDEKKYNRPHLPITKEQIAYYRNRDKDINVRPIKKVAEAKARKRKQLQRRISKARSKANTVTENEELSEREKQHEIKRIYKHVAQKMKKPEVKYVVARKSSMQRKRAHRPSGVEGRFKVVDKRMKADKRGTQSRKGRNETKSSGPKISRRYKGRRPKQKQ